MHEISTQFSPTKPISFDTKTWHTQFNDGIISGYVCDFKTEIQTIFEDGKKIIQSGLRIFINDDENEKLKYSVFVPYDPYFYVILYSELKKEGIEFLRLLKQTNSEKIKNIIVHKRHLFNTENDHFFTFREVFKIILYSSFDIKSLVDIISKNVAVKECREYDINFKYQAAIDLQLFCYQYYTFYVENGVVKKFEPLKKEIMPELKVFTFDIEVRKKPIKKPQADDPIDVIGIKYGSEGFIINNMELTFFSFPDFYLGIDKTKKIRKIEKNEIDDTILYPTIYYKVINVKNEYELLKKFYDIIVYLKPQAITGYASDFFDFPHIQSRGLLYNINFLTLFTQDKTEGRRDDQNKFIGDFKRDGVAMFDTMDWTERDSYLPKGMRGLKEITKELLGINAIEVNHEQKVIMWNEIKSKLLNPNYEENLDLNKFEENKRKAFNLAYNHLIYCASDTYITDIFATQSSLGLNIAVSTKIPMNLFEVSRKKRGPMVELYLLNKMRDKFVAPNKVMKKRNNYINPNEIVSKYSIIEKEIKKKIDSSDTKFWARCYTLKEMMNICKECNNGKCKEEIQRIWKLPSNQQIPILCKKKSVDDENPIYYFPLENQNFLVIEEKYEGAKVKCISAGVFKDNAKMKFKIQLDNLKQYEQMLLDSLSRLIKKTEEEKDKKTNSCVIVLEKEKLYNEIKQKFQYIYNNLKEENGQLYLYDFPFLIHVDVSSMYPSIIYNYNLQPYNIVTEKICNTCPYHYKEGEVKCWNDMKWNTIYKVMNINANDAKKAEEYIQNQINSGKEFEDEDEIIEIYKKFLTSGKIYNTYRFPIVSRFCQKSFKFFVNAIKEFRDLRYIYKYMMTEKEEEIAELYSKCSSFQIISDIFSFLNQENIKEDKIKEWIEKITQDSNISTALRSVLLNVLHEYKNKEKITNTYTKLSKIYKNKELSEDMKKKINELKIKKTFARNMQLAMKVLLNSIYGMLKSVGARFWSIDAAGVTCAVGQNIINFAINLCEKYACAINIEVDTDGLWTALPNIIPLELKYVYGFQNDSENKKYTGKFNIFNENLNYFVKSQFSNYNNYLPINERGEYNPEIEYTEEWNKNRMWKNEEKCEIKFDYEGPFSTIFVYTKKRMKIYKRNKVNREEQEVEEITGLDELRKGELGLIRFCSSEITDAYCKGNSIEEAYKAACDVVNNYIDQINNKTLDLQLILESRDLSERTVSKVNLAYKKYKEFISKYQIDEMNFPINSISIKEKTKNNKEWEEFWFGKKEENKKREEGILNYFTKNIYSVTAFRTIDLGIPIEIGDTVEWIISQYPRIKSNKNNKIVYEKEKVSQRAIPIRLFNGTEQQIKSYLKKWFGEDVSSVDIRDYIDWDFYLEKFIGMVTRYLIIPAQSQNIDVYQWLKIKREISNKKTMNTLLNFIHPLSLLQNVNENEENINKIYNDDSDDDDDDDENE